MSDKGFGEASFREKPDISQVFIRQIDRTNQIASMSHELGVYQIIANLPAGRRQWVYDQEDRYQTTELTLLYRKNCGVRIGTKDNPVLFNEEQPVKRLDDEAIDWDDPNIMSPILKEVTTIDYRKMNEIAMEAAQHAGLTWQEDTLEVDAGDTIEYIEERKRTPFRMPRLEEDDVEEDEDGPE